MKKFLLTLMVAVCSLTASAQVYLGGEVGFWRNSDDNHTNFTLKPQIGYELSNKWALGMSIGFTHDYYGSGEWDGETLHKVKINSFSIDPYARWSYAKFGPVKLFLDLGFGISAAKAKSSVKGYEYDDDALVSWRIGVSPGVSVGLAKNLDFVAHAGFLGYRESDHGYGPYGEHGFGFELSGYDLNFGLIYKF